MRLSLSPAYPARCIPCGATSRFREREAAGGRCPRCRHAVAFEPARDPFGTSDWQMSFALGRVSDGGTLRFTTRELWYEFSQAAILVGTQYLPIPWRPLAGFAAGAAAAGWLGAGLLLAAGVGAAAALAVLPRRAGGAQVSPLSAPPAVPLELFETRYLPRWAEVHGPPEGLLPPRAEAAAALPREVREDVAAFSFDRAVVTDRWEAAAMLVANRFHFEHNCAVLSLDGYPDGIAETVRGMLRRNPRLTVFAVHDATPEGCLLPFALRGEAWFPGPEVRLVDAGLRPSDTHLYALTRLPRAPGGPLPELRERLPAGEAAWLEEGNRAELAALKPAFLIGRLRDAVARAGEPDDVSRLPAGYVPVAGVIFVDSFSPLPRADRAETDGFG